MKRVLILVIFILLCGGCGKVVGYVDEKEMLDEKARNKYVEEELTKRYGQSFEVKFLEKNPLLIDCKKGECKEIVEAYIYTYECRDNNGVVFEVDYTDPYILEKNEKQVQAKFKSYYDDVLKYNSDNLKLINDYEMIIRNYSRNYKRIYKAGYDHFNYYEENDSFGYIYFIYCPDSEVAKAIYKEVDKERRHLSQATGTKVTIEFYFFKDLGLYNSVNVSSEMRDPATKNETTLEKLTGMYEQVIGLDKDEFNSRLYNSNDFYNIDEKHYYRRDFNNVVYYIRDGNFQVKGLRTIMEDVKAVIIKDYNYVDNPVPEMDEDMIVEVQ